MAFLRKKKFEDEENDFEEYEETPRSRRPKSRDFKDLKPENKRKRKEPKKPWGKKERIFLLLVIFLSVGTSGILALSSRSWKLPGIPRFALPSFSIPSFFEEETIVIEGRREDQVKADKAILAFKEKTSGLSGVYGLYVIRLKNDFSYGVNENETFQAASLIKLPVIAVMFMEAEEGKLDLDEKYSLKASDKVGGAGSLYGKPVGYEITYRNLIRLMGKQSDNTAYNIARRTLGDERINEVIRAIGMENTSLQDNETTPKDIGVFFEELWQGNVVNKGNKEEVLENLTDTIYEAWITEGIPDDVRVAHKFGRELHVVNDAGIIFADEPSGPEALKGRRPFVVVILSKGVVEREADSIFPELSKVIYDIETSQ